LQDAHVFTKDFPTVEAVIRDGGYDSHKIRELLAKQKIAFCIPPNKNRWETIHNFETSHRTRQRVQNLFANLNVWRGIAERYGQYAHTVWSDAYLAAKIIFWLCVLPLVCERRLYAFFTI
jgi:hypothetical protein